MSADRVVFFVVTLATTAILARLIEPAAFGLVGAALVVTEVLGLVASGVVTPALVQGRAEPEDHAAAFWMAALVAGALYGAVWLAAPAAAGFFAMPELTRVLRVLALVVVFDGLASVSRARQMAAHDFRSAVVVRVSADVVGFGIVSVALALGGWGVWALVGGRVAQGALRAAGYAWRHPHPLVGRVRGNALRAVTAFGGGMVLQGALNGLARQGDFLVVGRALGAPALGLYSRAFELMAMPAGFLTESFNGVLFPVLSRVQGDADRLARALERSCAVLALALGPLAVVLAVAAPELVRVVLGPGWEGAVEALRVLALGVFFRAGYKSGMTILRARGRVYAAAALQAGYAAAVIVGAALAWRHGLDGVAAAAVVALGLFYAASSGAALAEVGGPVRAFVRAHGPGLALTLPVGLAAWGARELAVGTGLGALPGLALVACAAGVAAGLALWAVPGLPGEHGRWALGEARTWWRRLRRSEPG